MVKRREIKNSTAEFLIFQIESKADGKEYQKLTDIYSTAIDYNRDAPTTRLFF